MNHDEDDPYRLPTEEELAHLGEYWWHSWLIDPIKRGDLPAIQRYLARKPEGLHTESPSYFDPFLVAAQQPDPGALRLLLQHWAAHPTPGAPPPNDRGSSLLHVACAHGALETVRYLLDEQPALVDLHARSAHGSTPLLDAAASFVSYARDEQAEMMAERAAHGRAQLDVQAARERVRRSEALVNLLLDCGACAHDSMCFTEWDTNPDPAIVDDSDDGDRDTVLSLAIARAGPTLLRRSLDEGADAFATTSDRAHHPFGYLFENTGMSRKLTLLHLAAFYGNYPGVQVLVEHCAQRGLSMADAVACRDQFGRLPIHYAAAGWPGALLGAARHGQDSDFIVIDDDTMALLRMLTDSGNPRLTNAIDQYGETPLHYAVSPNLITGRATTAVASFLCNSLHASGRLRGRGGETPLHRLCHGRPNPLDTSSSIDTRLLVALLTDLDEHRDLAADVNAVDDAGNTPLHLAVRCLANKPAAKFLLGRGADVRMRNKKGRTPLHEAAGVGQIGLGATVSVEESIRAQDEMLAVLCGSTEEGGLTLEKNWNALLDEEDGDGKTPRQIAEETRAAWREEAAERARPWDGTRGRGRGRGRGG